ncbi:MAG: FAD-dependent oxidoreductase [Rhizobiaceae bacterium]|nr:MAG: FAD-dependent oxidoreductase [Rhizobiaceae bacterium]CAG1013612.1 monoamine oxidase [Rhizobiaceae bacterium]
MNQTNRDVNVDVAVVGAGFTGLAAAHELVAAGLGVVVLEARSRVGGRVESQANALGERIDTGGQYFCDDMTEVTALARRFGKSFHETPVDGELVVVPPAPDADPNDLFGMPIRRRMKALEPADPAIAGLTVADWLARQPEPEAVRTAFRSSMEGLWCLPIEEVPLWYLVSNDRRIDNRQWELQHFLGETLHSLAEDLATGLGGRVRLSTPVSLIERSEDGVVLSIHGGTIRAREVLVAVPPASAARIAFRPALPPRLAAALGAWRSGAVIKILIRYATPFWRGRGLSGMVTWRGMPGLYACDASKDTGHPTLVVFAGGALARAWHGHSADELRRVVTAHLVEALGLEAAGQLDFAARDWTGDEWSGGAYSDLIVDSAAVDAEDVIRAGAPPIRFAASELSPSYPGYVEGALIAGRRAARALIAKAGA